MRIYCFECEAISPTVQEQNSSDIDCKPTSRNERERMSQNFRSLGAPGRFSLKYSANVRRFFGEHDVRVMKLIKRPRCSSVVREVKPKAHKRSFGNDPRVKAHIASLVSFDNTLRVISDVFKQPRPWTD